MLKPGAYLLWMHLGNHVRLVPPGVALVRNSSFFATYVTP